MPITFTHENPNGESTWRRVYEDIITQAIEASRPAGESWSITTHEPSGRGPHRIDFARGTETRRVLTLDLTGDNSRHSSFYRIVCQFLYRAWPGGIRPS
jgi:hypothetical protein